jgi:hypothetical protein
MQDRRQDSRRLSFGGKSFVVGWAAQPVMERPNTGKPETLTPSWNNQAPNSASQERSRSQPRCTRLRVAAQRAQRGSRH